MQQYRKFEVMEKGQTKIISLDSMLTAEEKKLVHLISKTVVSNTLKKAYDKKSHQVPENIDRQAKQLQH